MSTNPFRRSSLKEATSTANRSVPEPDGTSAVPLSLDTRRVLLSVNCLTNVLLTVVGCSPKLVSETRQLCITSRHSYISGIVSFFARVDEELTRVRSAVWGNNSSRLHPGYPK